jgi:hypothetical protein
MRAKEYIQLASQTFSQRATQAPGRNQTISKPPHMPTRHSTTPKTQPPTKTPKPTKHYQNPKRIQQLITKINTNQLTSTKTNQTQQTYNNSCNKNTAPPKTTSNSLAAWLPGCLAGGD